MSVSIFLRELYFVKNVAAKNFAVKLVLISIEPSIYYLIATDTHPNQPRTSLSMAIGPQTSQSRSLRSDQACTRLGRYVATEPAYGLVAT